MKPLGLLRRHRPLRELFTIAFSYVAIWMAVALFSTSEFYRFSLVSGVPTPWRNLVGFQVVVGLVWSLFTPIAVKIAEMFPIRRPNLLRNVGVLLLITPVLAVIRAAFGGMVLTLSEDGYIVWKWVTFSVIIRSQPYAFVFVIIFVVANVVLAHREATVREHTAIALEAMLANEQLEQLRAQLQPHFLFTTLQSIKDLVRDDPVAADRMLVSLSDLLRRSLEFDRRVDVTLAEELDFADRYLEIQRMRFGERFAVRVVVEEDVLAARVPPLLLQPLVENAVVHGIAPRGEGVVEIRGHSSNGMLRISVCDDGAGSPDTALAGKGSGLVNTRVRLERLFGERQAVSVRREEGTFIVEMAIPLRVVEEGAAA